MDEQTFERIKEDSRNGGTSWISMENLRGRENELTGSRESNGGLNGGGALICKSRNFRAAIRRKRKRTGSLECYATAIPVIACVYIASLASAIRTAFVFDFLRSMQRSARSLRILWSSPANLRDSSIIFLISRSLALTLDTTHLGLFHRVNFNSLIWPN